MKYIVTNDCLINMEEVILMIYDRTTGTLKVIFKNGVTQFIDKVNDNIYLQIRRILNNEKEGD